MKKNISLLDCTLRDGSYIVESQFGTPAIKGIIKKMQDAGVEIIECGWLKDKQHEDGSAFFHTPRDVEPYLIDRKANVVYAVMIDWDRYNLDNLPPYNGKSIDAIRVVFPYGKHREGIAVGEQIKKKGYQVFFQAANTMAYSNDDLLDLADAINAVEPVALSVVDTFGAMYEEDLERIVHILDEKLKLGIKLGFHSHNNQQLSFAMTIHFIKMMQPSNRCLVVDASLCGMGRGAGNATTELVVSYLNRMCGRNYDMDAVMDAIDTYMSYFKEKYQWGYSTPYFIAGMYCCHVNNIAYLLKNHRTNAKDMRSIIESLSPDDRRKYNYDLLERRYIENQSRKVDDDATMDTLAKTFAGRTILLIAPGKSISTNQKCIEKYIEKYNPIVIGVNAINPQYKLDYFFAINSIRYCYAKDVYRDEFKNTKRLLLSNVKTEGDEDEFIVNFSRVNKRGWEYFDNAVIDCLRLLDRLHVEKVAIAGFDGFKTHYNETYADESLPTLNPDNAWSKLNCEIASMFQDFKNTAESIYEIEFITDSIFNT